MKGTGDSKGVLIVQTGFCQQRTVSEVKLMRVSKRVPIPFKQDRTSQMCIFRLTDLKKADFKEFKMDDLMVRISEREYG